MKINESFIVLYIQCIVLHLQQKQQQKQKIMTNLDFRKALENGNADIIYIDSNGNNKEYTHTILKAGKKQITLIDNFLDSEYKLNFSRMIDGFDNKSYKLK